MTDSNFSRRNLGICLLLAMVTLLVFWPLHKAEFIDYDDNMYILENVHVQSGLSWTNLEWAFTSGYAANWHPLTWISHMLDCQFYGMRPGGHHLTNVLLHIVNALLLFGLLRSMTGNM